MKTKELINDVIEWYFRDFPASMIALVLLLFAIGCGVVVLWK